MLRICLQQLIPQRHLIYELRENLTNHEDIWQIALIWQQLGCKTFQKQTECHPLSRVGNENLKSLISSHNDDRNGAAFREAEGTLNAGPHFRLFWVKIFWGVESDARGNSVASEKQP